MALSLTDIAAGAVLQRRAGGTTRDVPVRFGYDSQPGAVQGRVVRADGSAVVDWVPLAGLTSSGGTGSGRVPSVPQGDGYRLQIRDGASGAVVAGANAWGVGVCVAFPGQSNMKGTLYGGWRGAEMDAYGRGPKLARSYTGGAGWSVFGHNLTLNNDSVYLFSRVLVAALGGTVPVGILPMAYNSLSIGEFLPGGAGHTQGILALDAAAYPGDLEMVFWHQGEANVSMAAADYMAKLGQVRQQFLDRVAPFGRTAATMLFAPSIIEGQDPPSGAENVRRAVLDFVAERRAAGEAADIGSSTLTIPSDGLHFSDDLGARQNMRRYIQTALKWLGAAAHGGRGPAIASGTRAGGTVTLTAKHEGGAGLRTQNGVAPTGFTLSTDGFVSDIRLPAAVAFQGADKIVLTLPPSIAAGTPVWVKYQGGVTGRTAAIAPTPSSYPEAGEVFDGSSYPDVSNPVYDDAALPPTVLNTSDDTVTGLPLLPLLTALRLVDGGTETVPAAYVSGSTGGTSVSPEGTGSTGTGSTGAGSTGPTGTTGGPGTLGGTSAPAGTPGRPLLTKRGGQALASDAARTRFLLTGTALATGTIPTKITGLTSTGATGGILTTVWNAYPGASYYRQEASTDGGVTYVSWGRTTTPDFSKGGLANGAYSVRVVAMTGQVNGVDDIAGSASDPITVTLGGTSSQGAGSGGSTGAGSTGGSAGGFTTVPPAVPTGAFSATYPWHIASGGTDIQVQRVLGNAPGEIPAGSKLTATVDGTPVTVQDLALATWPDGSRRAGVVSLTLPGTRAAGSVAQVVFGQAQGAADAFVSKSREQIAQDSDFELRFSGYDLGSDVFVVKMNDLISQAPSFPYGVNPSRGLDVLDAGPERTRLRGWAFVRRASDGAIHRTLKGFLYLDALRSGAYRATVRWTQDTIYGAFPGGTVGPAGPTRLNFVVELFNRGTRVAAWGGPNDPRARTVDGAALLSGSRFQCPADFPLGQDWAGGVGVAFSGALPSGLSTSQVYWPRPASGGFELHTKRREASAAAFGAGSGATTVFPVMHSFVASGGVGTGLDLHPVWIGPGSKPVVRPAHDRVHLFQRSRLTPPHRVDLQQAPKGGTPRVHVPGEVYGNDIWSISAVADDAGNSRLGFLPFAHSRLLYTPDDPVMWADVFSMAVSWADYPQDFLDERSGMPPVTSKGGTTDTGQTYPGFGPLNPGLENILNGGRGGNPRIGDAQVAGWHGDRDFTHGYADDYQLSNSFAHTPNWWYVPYLLTGDQVWLDLGMANCVAASMLWNHTHFSAPESAYGQGRAYAPVVTGQPRGIAWAFRDWSNWIHVAPDGHPYRRVLEDYRKINFQFYGAQAGNALGRHIGSLFAKYGPTEDWGGTPFHTHMLCLSLGMMLWRDPDPDLVKAIGGFKPYLLDTFSDDVVVGGGWFVNNYRLQSNNWDNISGVGVGDDRVFTTIAGKLHYDARQPGPYPTSGLKEGSIAPNAYVAMWLAATATWATAGVVGAGRVRKAMLRRLNGQESEIGYVAGGLGLVPQYAIAPVPGSPD